MPLVMLQEITLETVHDVIGLDVGPKQRRYVASNAVSIADAHFSPGAWFRAICADNTPVGFVMLFDPTFPGAKARGPIAHDQIGLWRLMIDHRYQRKGFGKRALDLVCGHIRTVGKAQSIISSYVAGSDGPEKFYLSYGFRKTGHLRNNGKEIEILFPLQSSN